MTTTELIECHGIFFSIQFEQKLAAAIKVNNRAMSSHACIESTARTTPSKCSQPPPLPPQHPQFPPPPQRTPSFPLIAKVVVPMGVRPGEVLTVQVQGFSACVAVPKGLPGNTFHVALHSSEAAALAASSRAPSAAPSAAPRNPLVNKQAFESGSMQADIEEAELLLGLSGPAPTHAPTRAPPAPHRLPPCVPFIEGLMLTRKDAWYAFVMANHARLGAASPFRGLPQRVLRVFWDILSKPIPTGPKRVNLEITMHTVHRVRAPGDYVVSNLRKFAIQVVLSYGESRRPAEFSLWLRARVQLEDGSDVEGLESKQEDCSFLGEVAALLIDGVALFRDMKMGKLLLSARHGGQRFRIRVEPREQAVRERYPFITVLSDPFRVVTKLPPPQWIPDGSDI